MSLMTNINPVPWSVVILAAAVAGGIWLYQSGASACDNRWKAAHTESLTRAIEQASQQAIEDAELLQTAAKAEQVIVTRTRFITREVARHVDARPDYRQCRIDDCGLCLALAAHGGNDPTRCPCEPDATLPGAARTTGGDGRIAQNLRRDGDAVSTVPGTTQGTDGVGGQ